MKVLCALSIILFSILLSGCSAKNAQVSSKLYDERVRRSPEFEATLRRMRSLLKDPVDEEHDHLEIENDDTHAREWTVQLYSDDDKVVRELAEKYGFDHVDKVGIGKGVYRFIHDGSKKRSEDKVVPDKLKEEQTTDDIVSKRDHIQAVHKLAADEMVMWFKRERILNREKRVPVSKKIKKEKVVVDNDPKFNQEWYIQNQCQTAGPCGFDSKVTLAWDMGFTGKGVTLSVLDDGMDHTHPELKDNYDPDASTDLNDKDSDPFPNDSDPYNAHGTKCGGTIAAKANNSICGVGIAHDSRIGAIRMLDGKATDVLEATALSYHRDHIDIYSCSWGPKDNGQTFGRPGNLGRIALAQGAQKGRNGLGSIFVWATGNGGSMHDDCNADGYVNNIYTIGIGSVNEHGVSTYYGEKCPGMFAVTYCSGQHSYASSPNSNANVITTYLHHQCTDHFVGTSSAAPLAAGIFALVLEANPKLTWRDLQHLIFKTAKQTSPMEPGWMKNGCGKLYNHKFGFGVLDASLLVQAALNWTTVAEQRSCHFKLNFKNGDIPHHHHFKLNFTTDGCQSCKKKQDDGKCKNGIKHLEHVVVNVTLKHRRRGDLSIDLISPSGTVSHLLHTRPYDCSSAGLKGWSFMTIFNWCEDPNGTWQLIFNDVDNKNRVEKKSRDMEEEYIQILDKEKKQEMDKRRMNMQEEEDPEDKVETKTEEQIYDEKQKREAFAKQAYENLMRARESNFKRDKDEYESTSYGNRYTDDYPYRRDYNERQRRETQDDEDTTDYVLYKKSGIRDSSQCGTSSLNDSPLAGQVEAISVTFFGTA